MHAHVHMACTKLELKLIRKYANNSLALRINRDIKHSVRQHDLNQKGGLNWRSQHDLDQSGTRNHGDMDTNWPWRAGRQRGRPVAEVAWRAGGKGGATGRLRKSLGGPA